MPRETGGKIQTAYDRGSHFYPLIGVEFLHRCLACLSVVSSKQSKPFLCIYLTLCLHKATQMEKDLALFTLPHLQKPKRP